MNRDRSPKRSDSLERVTEKGLHKQAVKDAKSTAQIAKILKAWQESGLSDQAIEAFKNAVVSWNLQEQEKFFCCLNAFGKLFIKLDYAHQVLGEDSSLGVVAIFLHVIDAGSRSYEEMACHLADGLSPQERQEVWRLHCLRELPDFLQYLPNVHTRLHLLLPKELRVPCSINTSLHTLWTALPKIDDWNHKLRLCSSWYLKKALALRTTDKIWWKVATKYNDMGLLFEEDPDFATLCAQFTQ
jgi:hypothetical protein